MEPQFDSVGPFCVTLRKVKHKVNRLLKFRLFFRYLYIKNIRINEKKISFI